MLIDLAMLVLAVSVLSLAELERREARMRAGAPAWGDLARITGVADPHKLARMPGVSLAGDGSLRFDPALRPSLPVHVTGSLVDHRVGHGLSLSLSLAALGTSLNGAALPVVAALLLGGAAGYQLLTRLYALVVWVEGRTGA